MKIIIIPMSGFWSQSWFFCLFGPKEAAYLKQVLLNTFCPLQQLSNPMQTAAGVWPNCRLEINPLAWARQSDLFRVAADISSNVVDFYFFVRSLSRLLCCVGSVSNVQSAGPLWTSDRPVLETSTWEHITLTTDIHAPDGIRTRNLSKGAASDPCPRGHWDRPFWYSVNTGYSSGLSLSATVR